MKYLRIEIVNTDSTINEETLTHDRVVNPNGEGTLETFSPNYWMDPVSACAFMPRIHEFHNLVIHKAEYKKKNRLVHVLIKLLCLMEEADLSHIDFNYIKENERW